MAADDEQHYGLSLSVTSTLQSRGGAWESVVSASLRWSARLAATSHKHRRDLLDDSDMHVHGDSLSLFVNRR